ncbi:MarR family winged helix-turn-helix transcriptional regulator [Streptacidiphilus monticola]
MQALILDNDRRRSVAEATGISFARSRALRRLVQRPLRMSELAAKLATDKPYTTLIVDDLVRRGLVERTTDPDDRRCKLVSLTETGRAMALRAQEILAQPRRGSSGSPRRSSKPSPRSWRRPPTAPREPTDHSVSVAGGSVAGALTRSAQPWLTTPDRTSPGRSGPRRGGAGQSGLLVPVPRVPEGLRRDRRGRRGRRLRGAEGR